MLNKDRDFSVPRFEGEFAELLHAAIDHYRLPVRNGDREESFLPLGGITYQEDRKLLLFGHGDGIRLTTAVADLDVPFNPKDYGAWANRFLRLPHFEELVTSQVDNEVAEIHKEDSLTGPPTVAVKLPYQHPLEGYPAALPLEESEFLSLFSGEKSQLARFYGGGLPQEIALVMEREFRNRRFGMVFFMHPSGRGGDAEGKRDDSDIKLNSVDGFRVFLLSLIEQYKQLKGDHLQALELLENGLGSGRIKIDSVCGSELLKMATISRIRLAADPSGWKSGADPELYQLFRGLDGGILSKIFGEKRETRDNRSGAAAAIIEGMLKVKAPEKPKHPELRFGTQRAVTMMQVIGSDYLKPGHSMAVFFTELGRWAATASTPAEFADIEMYINNIKSRIGLSVNSGEHLYEITSAEEVTSLAMPEGAGREQVGLLQVLGNLQLILDKRKGEIIALRLNPPEEAPDNPTWEKLNNPELRDLRRDTDDTEFERLTHSSDSVGLDVYLAILLSKIPQAKTNLDFDDLKILLEEVRKSEYAKSLKNWRLVLNDQSGRFEKTGPGISTRVGNLVDLILKDMVARRHRVLFGKEVQGLDIGDDMAEGEVN